MKRKRVLYSVTMNNERGFRRTVLQARRPSLLTRLVHRRDLSWHRVQGWEAMGVADIMDVIDRAQS